MNPTSRGLLYGLAATSLLGLMSALVRLLRGEIPAGELVLIRAGVGFLATLPIWWRREEERRATSGALLLRALLGSLAILLYFWLLQEVPVGVAQGFRFLTPGLIGIFSALALKEIPHPAQWLGMLVVSLGLALLVGPGVRPVSAWVALGGLSAATLTAGALTALRSASRLHSPHQIVRFFLIFLALVGLSTYDARWCLPTSAQWPALVGMGLAGYWGQFYLSHSFELLSAPVAGTIGLCSLVWGVAFESLLTDYFPKPTELGAYAILLVGATILVHYERPRKD